MTSVRVVTATLAGLGLAVSLTACSSSDTAEINEQYCSSSDATQREIAELASLITGGDATMDDVRSQIETIKESASTARDDAADLSESVRTDIESADQAFEDEVAAIPDDATLSEAVTAYDAAIKNWEAAVAGIRADVGC